MRIRDTGECGARGIFVLFKSFFVLTTDVLYSKAKIRVSSAATGCYSAQKNGNAIRIPVSLIDRAQCLTAPTASLVSTFGIATGSVFSGKGSGLRSSANSNT